MFGPCANPMLTRIDFFPFLRGISIFSGWSGAGCFSTRVWLSPLRPLPGRFSGVSTSCRTCKLAFFTIEKLILSAFSPKLNLFSDKRLCQCLNIEPCFDFYFFALCSQKTFRSIVWKHCCFFSLPCWMCACIEILATAFLFLSARRPCLLQAECVSSKRIVFESRILQEMTDCQES